MPKFTFSLPYFICAFFVLWIMIKTLKRKDRESRILTLIMIFASVIVFSYGITFVSNNYYVITFFFMLLLAAINFMLLFLCGYVYSYISGKRVYKVLKISTLIITGIDSIMLLLNPFLGEFVMNFTTEIVNGNLYIDYNFKLFHPYLYVHLAISYTIFICVIILIVNKCIKSPRVYCEKYYILLTILSIIVILNLLFYTKILLLPFDISFLFFSIGAIIIYYFNYNYQPVFLLSKARGMVLDNIKIPFVMFDNEDRLVDVNKRALEILPIGKKEKTILTKNEFINRLGIKLNKSDSDGMLHFDVVLKVKGEETYFHGDYDSLTDNKGRLLGDAFVFHDHTSKELLFEELNEIANYDPLTGLYNEYNLNSSIKKTFMSIENMPISIGVIKINEIDCIEYIFGKQKMEEVIKFSSSIIRKALPRKDYVARIDNEFVLVMNNTNKTKAIIEIEKITKKIEALDILKIDITIETGIRTIETLKESFLKELDNANQIIKKKLRIKKFSKKENLILNLKEILNKSKYENNEHCHRIFDLSRKIALKLELSGEDIDRLEKVANFHDIGKVSIPDTVLNKQISLEEEEWEQIKTHSEKGFKIIKESTELNEIAFYVYALHEKWDGNGYPNQLKGKDIPEISRIIAIAEAYDVMTHDNTYRTAISKESAIGELLNNSGKQFDPDIVRLFVNIIRKEN